MSTNFMHGKKRQLLFFLFSAILGLNSCRISDCQKAEEIVYAKYRYSLTHDSIRNGSNRNEIIRSKQWYDMTFDCNHRYTKRYIRKHLGKPIRIYINDTDNWLGKNYFYEDWLYPAHIEYPPNEKPFIGEILILRFEPHRPILKRVNNCPSKYCHKYNIISGPDEIHTDAILLLNSDSFDIKYPYILKNEQKFYLW